MGDISLHVCFWSLQWLIEWFNSSMTTTAICFWSLQWFSFEFICMIVTTALFFFGLCSGLQAGLIMADMLLHICFWFLQQFISAFIR